MKKSSVLFFMLALVVLVAVFTNPNEERHKEVIRAKLKMHLQQSIAANSTDNALDRAGQALVMLLGGALIDGIIANVLSTDNYVLFSTSKITWDGETKIIGIGVFGNVFLTREIENALENGLLEP
jgi:flagellar biosynthesis protein FlhB